MTSPLYRGYSSVDLKSGVNTSVYDVDAVKQALRNEFNTRLGERRMRPFFGSIVHDLLFDLMDPRTETMVYADAERIFRNDPLVEPVEIRVDVDIDRHEIVVTATLNFVEFDMNDIFSVTFGETQ